MSPADWDAPFGRAVGVYLNGDGIRHRGPRGERLTDRHFLIYCNAHVDPVPAALPNADYADEWEVVIDTGAAHTGSRLAAGAALDLAPHSIVVLRQYVAPPVVDGDPAIAASLSTATPHFTSSGTGNGGNGGTG